MITNHTITKTWWKESIVYQIYPRSFKDTSGNGVGDLRGIIEKLDHIKALGIDVIWLSPVYESPNDDNGYDIADYRAIMKEFGTMADFDEMLQGIHDRGMKLIMDLVANHTSDEHAWFEESRSSKVNPKRDYYIWKDGKKGPNGELLPPNNWRSFFSGPAWEYDDRTGQFYLHLFTRKQPDLNWENPLVRKEIGDIVEFWLKKGVDGFRMDVISLISKRGYEDSPYNSLNETIQHIYANGPRVHEFLQEMYENVLSKYDIMTVGEGPGIDLHEGPLYVKEQRKELNMIFHFGHMFMDQGPGGKFDPIEIDFLKFKQVFVDWDRAMKGGGWNSIFLDNHDFPRMVSRFGNDTVYWKESAKMLATLLMTMRGTPYIYQGDEIGMTNVAFESLEDYRDVETLNAWEEEKAAGRSLEDFMKAVHRQGRDNVRTPYQWNNEPHAGFTKSTPWIKVNPNYTSINLEAQWDDPDSILHYYRRVITFRKKNTLLVYGEFELLKPEHPTLLVYERFSSATPGQEQDSTAMLVMMNFSNSPAELTYQPSESLKDAIIESCLIGNYPEPSAFTNDRITLKPWEAQVLSLNRKKIE